MEILTLLKVALQKPGAIRPRVPFFLLSHMRANTSLCGHILGSHPEIDGYYEMHKGYYSWKSFVRQRLTYYRDHPVKKESQYIFDKVLHDFHYVDTKLISKVNAKVMFSIREPRQTIKSAVHQFRANHPQHEFCDIENVTHYYISRLNSLCKMSREVPSYFYYDADQLRSEPDILLSQMSQWLELKSPLSTEFESFHFSGKGDTGDLSGRLAIGKVVKKKTDYSSIEVPADLEKKAIEAYLKSGELMKASAVNQ